MSEWLERDLTEVENMILEALAARACTAGWCCGKTCYRACGALRKLPDGDDVEPCGPCIARKALGGSNG